MGRPESGYSKYATFSGNGGNEYIIREIKAIIPSHCARNDVHHNWTKAGFGRPRHLECSPATATTRVLEIVQTSSTGAFLYTTFSLRSKK